LASEIYSTARGRVDPSSVAERCQGAWALAGAGAPLAPALLRPALAPNSTIAYGLKSPAHAPAALGFAHATGDAVLTFAARAPFAALPALQEVSATLELFDGSSAASNAARLGASGKLLVESHGIYAADAGLVLMVGSSAGGGVNIRALATPTASAAASHAPLPSPAPAAASASPNASAPRALAAAAGAPQNLDRCDILVALRMRPLGYNPALAVPPASARRLAGGAAAPPLSPLALPPRRLDASAGADVVPGPSPAGLGERLRAALDWAQRLPRRVRPSADGGSRALAPLGSPRAGMERLARALGLESASSLLPPPLRKAFDAATRRFAEAAPTPRLPLAESGLADEEAAEAASTAEEVADLAGLAAALFSPTSDARGSEVAPAGTAQRRLERALSEGARLRSSLPPSTSSSTPSADADADADADANDDADAGADAGADGAASAPRRLASAAPEDVFTSTRFLALYGHAVSLNCNFSMNVTAAREVWDEPKLEAKATGFALLATLGGAALLGLTTMQMVLSTSQAASFRVSLLTMGAQAVVDCWLSFAYTLTGMVSQGLFSSFAALAFVHLVLFTVL
jgi:hypothetical protein